MLMDARIEEVFGTSDEETTERGKGLGGSRFVVVHRT